MFKPGSARSNEALRASIEHASKAPFYAEVWRRISRHGSPTELLARLPLLDKETAAREQERLVVPGVRAQPPFLEAGIVSSATTRQGRPLRVLTSPDEQPLAPPTPSPSPGAKAPAPRSLYLYSPRHGVPVPDGRRVFMPATLHPNTVDVLDDLLSASGEGGGFSFLVGPLSALKWLSVALVERGIAPAGYRLRGIGTTGHALTAHARRWLEPLWRAPFFDNFSLSELRGYAHPCSACGYAHWHGAPVHFELIDPLRLELTKAAIGELVATTLVPSVLRMPLVRYRTGDLVEVGPACSRAGSRGIRPRGRISQSWLRAGAKTTEYVVLSRDLQEAAEAQPDVALEPHPAEVLGRVPPSDLGVPRAKVDVEARCVRVELRYDPARHPERAKEVEQTLGAALFGPEGREGWPRLELSRPGTIDVRSESLKLS